ncbi:TIGR04283 family arsenosugar biosynthesis glycosyltransferase [Teichococcus vastitatis]|uniref:TIGR04283 family arsenosugar biosynthesis glycosyltransferase n=1 Tax=Teichococcus vastitatis TaxID=2307076 RepID=A0ABS9W720_9PROT|nr:TIGR04283 family arsenosugar biosynthesis glycosyltransferase [Pseudoroseomonas vastitatis]MCI0755088.1 TIGR04283 family arsenosugar biosynthesis glycosyltransferase [Pseudoroseomonas vastitatis]
MIRDLWTDGSHTAGGTTPPGERPRLSVIIPLAQGETEAPGLLGQLCALPAASEVLLVQAGGETMELPKAWPAALPLRLLSTPAGRARQMNAGAATARGEWLWFLHADTRLDAAALGALQAVMSGSQPVLGWFSLAFGQDGPALARWNARGANWRSRRLGLPFGDQGFVLPALWFHRLGGFDETAPYGEDHLLVWAARGAGLPLREINATLTTSARKYARHGWLRTTWLHWRLTARQALGAWWRLKRKTPT